MVKDSWVPYIDALGNPQLHLQKNLLKVKQVTKFWKKEVIGDSTIEVRVLEDKLNSLL